MKLIIEKNKIKNEVDTKATTLPPMPKLRPPKDTTDFEISSNAGRVRLLTMLQSLLDIRKRQIEKTSDIVMFDDVLDDDGMEIPTAKKLFPDDESLKAAIKKVSPGLYQKADMKTEEAKKDACYHKVKSRYKVWPSAYASGALVKCRKVGAKNWGNKSKKNEEVELDEKKKSWSKSERSKRAKKCANPKGFTMKQFCKNQNSKSKKGEKKNESFDVNERCQKGYKTHPTRKTKIMFGKKYRNCVKAEEGKDPKKGTGKKPKGSGRRLYTDENPKDTVSVKFSSVSDIRDTFSKSSFKNKSHKRQSQIINLVHQRVRAAYKNAKDPKVKARLKKALDYAENRKEASKRKTQRMKDD